MSQFAIERSRVNKSAEKSLRKTEEITVYPPGRVVIKLAIWVKSKLLLNICRTLQSAFHTERLPYLIDIV